MTHHRHFGLISGPVSLRGHSSTDRPASGARNTGADPHLSGFSPDSEGSNLPLFIPISSPLERGKVAQAALDIGTALFWLFFFSVALTGFGLAVWAVTLVIIRSVGL